jgi:hypothetical protein
MGRQIPLGRLILVVFFVCSVCLPVGHTCLDYAQRPASAAQGRDSDRSRVSDSGDVFWLGVLAVSSAGGTCLACLWSHSQLHEKAASEYGVPCQFASGASLPESSPRAASCLSEASAQRGPPPALTA